MAGIKVGFAHLLLLVAGKQNSSSFRPCSTIDIPIVLVLMESFILQDFIANWTYARQYSSAWDPRHPRILKRLNLFITMGKDIHGSDASHIATIHLFSFRFGRNYIDVFSFSIRLRWYYRRTVHYNQTYTLHTASQIVTHPKFRLGYKTVMYMHGYSDGANNRSVKSVANAYKLRGNYNIIAVDYADLVAERYFREALPNTIQVICYSVFCAIIGIHKSSLSLIYPFKIFSSLDMKIAPHITTVVMKWFDKGLNDQLVHLIGHSLGAQLAGIIGREVIQRSNNQRKIRRITGLDPAGPGFFYGSNLQTLESSDATFVVNIHTDAPLFGAPCATGHVDFWPNFATVQPGCPDPENSPGQSPGNLLVCECVYVCMCVDSIELIFNFLQIYAVIHGYGACLSKAYSPITRHSMQYRPEIGTHSSAAMWTEMM